MAGKALSINIVAADTSDGMFTVSMEMNDWSESRIPFETLEQLEETIHDAITRALVDEPGSAAVVSIPFGLRDTYVGCYNNSLRRTKQEGGARR